MKEIFKRLKLSQYMLMFQIVTMIIALVLNFTNNIEAETLSLVFNIISGIIVLVAFFCENSSNVKYYEVTSQFIFDGLEGNFSGFMDFLMSDEYKKRTVNEHIFFQEKLINTATKGSYDAKRKISRALPELFMLDKNMAKEIMRVLREDIYEDRTDIRRRTVEAILIILQKAPTTKKKKLSKAFFDFIKYAEFDDSYTIVACVECYYYIYKCVAKNTKQKEKVLVAFSKFKEDIKYAQKNGIGYIEESVIQDFDVIWAVLEALSNLKNTQSLDYVKNKNYIEAVLSSNGKFAKLSVVKNLRLTCKGYPKCLSSKTCSVNNTGYMMEKTLDFLTHARDNDVFLSMPAVRYFDCVCNNINKGNTKNIARRIICEYFTHSNILINKTAFDKFTKLIACDRTFAQEILEELLTAMNSAAEKEIEEIGYMISILSEEKQKLYKKCAGRTKYKIVEADTMKGNFQRSEDKETNAIDRCIKYHHERIRFIGKIKQMRELKIYENNNCN